MRVLSCCLAVAAVLTSGSWANSATAERPDAMGDAAHRTPVVTRAYVMYGLLGELFTSGMDQIAAKLRAHGAVVEVGSWTQASAFAADACAHRRDRIIFIGHSLGATAAASAATDARACDARNVAMVGIDPPPLGAAVKGGARAVNFVGALNGSIAGARNVPVPGYGHIAIVDDPAIQNRVVAAALSH